MPTIRSAAESFGLNCHALVNSNDDQMKIMYNLSRGLYDLAMALEQKLTNIEEKIELLQGRP